MGDTALFDAIIAHSIDLLRLDAGIRAQILYILGKMEAELKLKLAEKELTAFNRQRTKQLLKETSAVIDGYYSQAQGVLDLNLEAIAPITAKDAAKSLVIVTTEATLPPAAYFKSLVGNLLIQGAPSAEWWSRQSADTAFKFSSAIRQGLAQGETNAQLIGRIAGGKGQAGIMDLAKQNAEALVRTSVQTVASEARLETFKHNKDVVKGLEQVSTLDGRTTEVCVAYSGAQWDLHGNPINGHTLPFNLGVPRHWNCRSVLVPITKTFKELGINFPEASKGSRASIDGQVSADTTFDSWLSRRTVAQQDEQLGKGRAQLWRNGTITLQQLLDQRGNPLSLVELKAKIH